ncbi:MAG TPA: hypothetical protein VGK99_18820 [Acidobacteriota bacterium]|jgi:hypothetical protein
MLPQQLALVSETKKISTSELTKVGAALQKQVMRDFVPAWKVEATVSAFAKLEDVPIGYWPIIVRDDIDTPGAAGVHEDKDGQPFALVQYGNSWSLTASHECLEMLADPFGNRLIAGPSIKPDQGRVEYLVEVCDPSEDAEFAYTVNGVMVSDFYTPHFFDPLPATGVQYSFTCAIKSPREVLKGGYLSWHDPVTDHWWQQIYFGSKKQFRDLGVFGQLTESLRSTIDRMTPLPRQQGGLKSNNPLLMATRAAAKTVDKATSSKAKMWHTQIKQLLKA